MAKIYDIQIEVINDALRDNNYELYQELKEEYGFQELWEIEKDKEETYRTLIAS